MTHGENQKQLTKNHVDAHPTWAPDSKSIAFHSLRRDGGVGIYLVDISSSDVDLMLHAHGDSNYQPDWYHPGPHSVSPAGAKITIWGTLKSLFEKSFDSVSHQVNGSDVNHSFSSLRTCLENRW